MRRPRRTVHSTQPTNWLLPHRLRPREDKLYPIMPACTRAKVLMTGLDDEFCGREAAQIPPPPSSSPWQLGEAAQGPLPHRRGGWPRSSLLQWSGVGWRLMGVALTPLDLIRFFSPFLAGDFYQQIFRWLGSLSCDNCWPQIRSPIWGSSPTRSCV
jgi:hypothetical protein